MFIDENWELIFHHVKCDKHCCYMPTNPTQIKGKSETIGRVKEQT